VKLNNLELSLPRVKAAIDAEPARMEYRLDLVRLYGAMSDYVSANAALSEARKRDRWGLDKNRLDSEAALLAAAQTDKGGK